MNFLDMKKNTPSVLFFILVGCFVGALTDVYGGATAGIGGYYETEFSARRDSSEFEWNLSGFKHYFQGKFWSNPAGGVDFFQGHFK